MRWAIGVRGSCGQGLTIPPGPSLEVEECALKDTADTVDMLPEDLSEKVILRSPTSSDVDKMEAYFASLGQGSRDFFHPHPFDHENARRVCENADDAVYCIVAEYEDRIIGYAWFGPSDRSPYPMLGIGISDDAQGRGLGGVLMDALIEEAKRRGHKGLRLTVYPNNERAVRLYTKRGFRVVGEKGREHVMDLVF